MNYVKHEWRTGAPTLRDLVVALLLLGGICVAVGLIFLL